MQSQQGYKRLLPHFLIIGIFIAISCIFCYPAFQGKTLDQHDIKTWLWMSRESREYHAETGENALWANNMFGGMPMVQTDYHAETNWYNKLSNIIQLYSPGVPSNPAVFFFLAMASCYILMITLRADRWLAAIGSIAFAFSTYNPQIITAGHTTKMLDIAFLPAILAGMIIAYRGKYLAGAALSGLFLAFFFDANHIQIIYYSLFVVGALGIAALVAAIKKGKLKQWVFASIALAVAATFAVGTSASRLIQTVEYNPYSIRGGQGELEINGKKETGGLDKEYAFQWSNGVGEAFTILVPGLYGAGESLDDQSHYATALSNLGVPMQQVEQMAENAPLYWGPQPFMSGSIYFGAVICFLFVLALFIVRSKHKWWIAALAFFFIFLSMGRHFPLLNDFMFDHFPMYNKFRSPNMAMAISSLLFPVLAVWALKDIFSEKMSKEVILKKVKYSLMVTGGLCLVILIATQTSLDYKGENDARIEQQFGGRGPEIMKAIREDRASEAAGNTLRSLVFVLLAGGVLWAYSKNKANKTMAVAGLGLLVAFDIIPVAKRFLGEKHFLETETYHAVNFEPNPADAEILKDKDPYYRVFNLAASPFQDARTSYFHNSVGGYHGAKMRSYQELIEQQLSNMNSAVLNMLNTKYFIVPGNDGREIPQRNPGACGNAWFVNEIKWVKTANEEMEALNAPPISRPTDTSKGNFQPLQTAIIRDTFRSIAGNKAIGKDDAAYVRLAPNGYGPRRIKFESANTQDGLAVFSDIYYPIGWTATIDGKPAPIIRTNYVLRALMIPAGNHTIEFSFDPPSYEKGERLGLFGSIALTAFILVSIYFTFFRKNQQAAQLD
jgi:hypothetical protein